MRWFMMLFFVLPWPGITVAATAQGKAIADACAACHGPEGRGQGAIPSIDTFSEQDFLAALQAFRADTRQGTVMNRIAKGFQDAELQAVARYFVTLRSQ